MAEKLQAIVIKSNDRKEKDRNILLFSIEKGKVWCTLKGVKSPKAKMKLAQNPFCFGEFVLENGKAGLIVTGFEAIETFHEISEDIDKFFSASAVLEVINSMNFSSLEDNTAMFILLLKTLKAICFSQANPVYVLNKFLLTLFEENGFPLTVEKCSCCGTKAFEKLFINYSVGELVCFACKTFDCEELTQTSLSAMRILTNTSLDKLHTIKLAENSEMALLRVLGKNYERRFDKKLKFIGLLS